MILGFFVTLFFPNLYTGPKYTDVGLKVRVEGLIEMLEVSAGAGTEGPLTPCSGE